MRQANVDQKKPLSCIRKTARQYKSGTTNAALYSATHISLRWYYPDQVQRVYSQCSISNWSAPQQRLPSVLIYSFIVCFCRISYIYPLLKLAPTPALNYYEIREYNSMLQRLQKKVKRKIECGRCSYLDLFHKFIYLGSQNPPSTRKQAPVI